MRQVINIYGQASAQLSVKSVQVAVAVIEGVMSYMASNEEKEWRNDISEMLDEIGNKVDQIIRDLQELKILVLESSKETARILYRDGIEASRFKIELLSKEIGKNLPDDEQRQMIRNCQNELINSLIPICRYQDYGFAHYHYIVSGLSSYLYAHKLLTRGNVGLNLTGVIAATNKIILYVRQFFIDGLSEQISGSPASALRNWIIQHLRGEEQYNSNLEIWYSLDLRKSSVVFREYSDLNTIIEREPPERPIITGNLQGILRSNYAEGENIRTEIKWHDGAGRENPVYPGVSNVYGQNAKVQFFRNGLIQQHRDVASLIKKIDESNKIVEEFTKISSTIRPL